MKILLNVKHLGAFLVAGILLVAAVFLTGRAAQPSAAQDFDVALIDSTNPATRWEYKSILLAPGADKVLNAEVSEFGWEFLGTTNDYALFRKGVASE